IQLIHKPKNLLNQDVAQASKPSGERLETLQFLRFILCLQSDPAALVERIEQHLLRVREDTERSFQKQHCGLRSLSRIAFNLRFYSRHHFFLLSSLAPSP